MQIRTNGGTQTRVAVSHEVTNDYTDAMQDGASFRRNLARWSQLYPARAIPNQGYRTHGLLVSLREFKQIAQRVYT